MRILLMFLFVFPILLSAADKDPDPNLCSVKYVYITGNNEAAQIIRGKISNMTWMKFERVRSKTDAEMDVREQTKSQLAYGLPDETSIHITLIRYKPEEEFLWADAQRVGVFGSATSKLLERLNKAARCDSSSK